MVLVILALVLGSCARSAEERELETAVPDDGTVTTEPIPGGAETPVPGETVVSAVTPSPGAGTAVPQPTQAQAGATGTPGAAQPAATDVPAATQPAATQPAGTQPTSAPPASGETVVHTVQPGESLSSIARRYGTTWEAIAQANGLVNPDQIYAGQQLKIGVSSSGGTSGGSTGCRLRHTVRQGEWVWQIARTYGADPYDILAANGLSVQTANTIYPGTVLCIP
ncbi:MAG TPA: LysM peptidoglycan-binding domain-containing protein [Anaerolineae bacterium]|nr:LysM peptidoglycan-binding domain-containing protein [Anaerolineae bacterium]